MLAPMRRFYLYWTALHLFMLRLRPQYTVWTNERRTLCLCKESIFTKLHAEWVYYQRMRKDNVRAMRIKHTGPENSKNETLALRMKHWHCMFRNKGLDSSKSRKRHISASGHWMNYTTGQWHNISNSCTRYRASNRAILREKFAHFLWDETTRHH